MGAGRTAWKHLALCGVLLFVSACGTEEAAPTLAFMVDGWPTPEGEWSAIYRVSVEMASDDFFQERDKLIPAKGTLSVQQRESAIWSDKLSIEVVRGLVTGTLEREVGGKPRKGSLGDLVGMGREEGTADALKSWLTAPGTSTMLPWNGANGAAPGLVLSLVPRPSEPPSEGLRWDHDTVFLPSLEQDTVLRATSTLTSMGSDRWTVESVITSGEEGLVEGKRTLSLSPRDGSVLEGSFEGVIRIKSRRGTSTIRAKGRIERIEAASVPAQAQQVEDALRRIADDDPATRAAAAKTLGSLFPHGGRGGHVLSAAARDDEDTKVRRAAAEALLRLADQSVPPIVALLNEFGATGRDDLLTTVQAIRAGGTRITTADVAGAVRAAPKGGSLAMALTPFAGHRSGEHHAHGDVCEVLSNGARPIVESGVHVRDPDTVGFTAMAMALHAAGTLPPSRLREAPDALLSLLKHEDRRVAWIAARMIAVLGTRGTKTMAALQAAAKEERALRPVRTLTAAARPNEPDALEKHVKSLAAKLPPGDGKVGREHLRIVTELGEIGSDAKSALPDLERVFNMSHRGGGRPSVRALIVAEALCRVDRPTGKRVGLFTVTLRPMPDAVTKEEKRIYVARAQRAASALGGLVREMRSPKMRKQIGQRALEALRSYQDAGVVADLLHVLESLGTEARFAVPSLSPMLQQAEKDWRQTLVLDAGAHGNPDRADRASLLLAYGNDVSRELVLRHGITRAFRSIGGEKSLPVLEWLADTTDPLLRYEVARALRKIRK